MEIMHEYNTSSCLPPWDTGGLEHKVDEALKILPVSNPAAIGSALVGFADEVVTALGIQIHTDGAKTVVERDGEKEDFVAAKQITSRKKQFENAFRSLAPELPSSILKAAAETMAAAPPAPPEESAPANPFDLAEECLSKLPQDVLDEAKTLLKDPKLLAKIVQLVGTLGYDCRGREKALEGVILGLMMRLTGESSYVAVRGPRGCGKTEMIARAVELQPPELVVKMTSISPKALVRRGEFDLKYRIVRFGERLQDDADTNGSASQMVRQFVSDNEYTYEVVNSSDTGNQLARFRIEGPTAFIESTTSSRIFAEDESRQIAVWLRSTLATSEATADFQIECAMGLHSSGEERARAKLLGNAVFWQLKPQTVEIEPSADPSRLKKLVDFRDPDASRRIAQMLVLVKAHALLHQHQRAFRADGVLLAGREDVEAVVEIVTALQLAEPLTSAPHASLNEVTAALALAHQEFGASELALQCSSNIRTANRWLSAWLAQGFVEQTVQAIGSLPSKYRFTQSGLADFGIRGVA
jgi:hypothetical protein